MKILLFANTDWYLYNFRLSLAKRLRDEGHDVVLVSPPGEYGPRLRELGFRWIPVDFSTASTNPLAELALLSRIRKLYQTEKPDLCHHFTIKCVLYGSIAARFAGIPAVVNAVTGMGHIFTDPGLKARVLRPLVRGLYRFDLGRRGSRVIFQNDEDRNYFVSNKLVRQASTVLIRGSGVDCTVYRPVNDESKEQGSRFKVQASHQSRVTSHESRPLFVFSSPPACCAKRGSSNCSTPPGPLRRPVSRSNSSLPATSIPVIPRP